MSNSTKTAEQLELVRQIVACHDFIDIHGLYDAERHNFTAEVAVKLLREVGSKRFAGVAKTAITTTFNQHFELTGWLPSAESERHEALSTRKLIAKRVNELTK